MHSEPYSETVMFKSARVRVLLLIVLGISATLIAIWILQKRFGYQANGSHLTTQPAAEANFRFTEPTPELTPATTPTPPASEAYAPAEPSPTPTRPPLTLEPSYIGRLNLVIPVRGVKSDQLIDTFSDARSEGRVHDAIDIPAPAGTPVIATAEGEIIKLFESERGGTTIYQASRDKKLIFYYAHLQRYADGLAVGKTVWQGETIGYVGDTGNAGPGNYHLHFSIMITKDPKRYWEGTNINPYPFLRK